MQVYISSLTQKNKTIHYTISSQIEELRAEVKIEWLIHCLHFFYYPRPILSEACLCLAQHLSTASLSC